MKTFTLADTTNPQEIFNGGLSILNINPEVTKLLNHAKSIVEDCFSSPIEDITHDNNLDLDHFIASADKSKTRFTDGEDTKELLTNLIKSRYSSELLEYALFDKPRLRIIPNSDFLSSGISYNYKPHRDTWYGGTEEQINHWLPLCNVTPETTFYVSPEYFDKEFENNSEIFDLDQWDVKFRKKASSNVKAEDRPHPTPLKELPESARYRVVIPRGNEFVFSGHHFHGSSSNKTNLVRFSIDYRVVIQKKEFIYPRNIDNRATGNFKKQMQTLK